MIVKTQLNLVYHVLLSYEHVETVGNNVTILSLPYWNISTINLVNISSKIPKLFALQYIVVPYPVPCVGLPCLQEEDSEGGQEACCHNEGEEKAQKGGRGARARENN